MSPSKSQSPSRIVGTAGWSIARELAPHFAPAGSSLARYASRFSGVEINSSFYRRHQPATWQRWHDAVPDDFRFAVKLPKCITHDLRLAGVAAEIETFWRDIAPLGGKLGPILVQLPPSLVFDAGRDQSFFADLRQRGPGRIVVEPRHVSWASSEAVALLQGLAIDRVYADPQAPDLRSAVDISRFAYLRLHGAPRIYYSAYSDSQVSAIGSLLRGANEGSWCIFDNTASGAALRNALDLSASMQALVLEKFPDVA